MVSITVAEWVIPLPGDPSLRQAGGLRPRYRAVLLFRLAILRFEFMHATLGQHGLTLTGDAASEDAGETNNPPPYSEPAAKVRCHSH